MNDDLDTTLTEYDTGRYGLTVGPMRVIFDSVDRNSRGDFTFLQDGDVVGGSFRVPLDNDVMHQLDEIAEGKR